MGETTILGLENQIVPNDAQRFQISRAAFTGSLPLRLRLSMNRKTLKVCPMV
jgi:hypothetical protein